MSTPNAASLNKDSNAAPVPPVENGADIAPIFPLAGKTNLTNRDIDRLLKKALMDKYADIEAHKKSYKDEWAADLPTFYKTIIIPNTINVGETVAASGVIGYIKHQIHTKEKEFKDILKIWSQLREDLNNPETTKNQAYHSAEEKMRHNGIGFEGMDNFDLRSFSKNKFIALNKTYNSTFAQRVKNTGKYLTRTPKTHLRFLRKTLPGQSKNILKFAHHFAIGLKENIKNPQKFQTPKAILGGARASFNIAAEFLHLKKEGFNPLQKQLHKMKDEYLDSDIEIDHWNHAIEIERDIGKSFKRAIPLFAAYSAATIFMVLHAKEGIEYSIENPVNNAGPLLVNIFSMVAGAGPLKELGHDLERKWKKLGGDRAHLAEQYIRMHEDRKNIEKHESSEAGFKAMTL